jgi:hypothetical protein
MPTKTEASTTTAAANVPRAANRTLDDVTQMSFRSRQPAAAPSAATPARSAPVAPTTGTPAPAPNEATPASPIAATESPPTAAALANAAAAGPAPEVPVSVSATNQAGTDAGAPSGEAGTDAGGPSGAAPEAGTDAGAPSGEAGTDAGGPSAEAIDDGTASPLLAEPTAGEAAEEADPLAAEVAAAINAQDVPRAVRLLTNRLGKVTGQLRETEQRLHATERAQLEPAPEAAPAVPAGAAFEHPALREIDGERARVLNALEILERHPDGGPLTHRNGQPVVDAKSGQQFEMTVEQVRDMRFQYNEALRQLGEERMTARLGIAREHEQARSETIKEARALYPWFWDKTSREYGVAAQILREAPGLKRHPRCEIVVGRQVTGLLAEQDRRAKPALARTAPPMKAPRSNAPPAPVVTSPAAPAARAATPQKQLQEAKGKQRSWKDQAHVFALERQARTSAAA